MAVELAGLLLIFFSAHASWAQENPEEVVGVVGGVAYLSPQTQTHFQQAEWRQGNTLKIAIRESGVGVRYPNGRYKGRLKLFPNNTLRMERLEKEDSSTYQVYLEDENGIEHTESVRLRVYDVVPKPTVRAIVQENTPERCNVTLKCSVGLEDVTYEWEVPPSRVTSKDGSELSLSFNPLLENYTCKVSNAVSSNSSWVSHRHPCTWEAEPSAATTTIKSSVLISLGHLLLLLALL